MNMLLAIALTACLTTCGNGNGNEIVADLPREVTNMEITLALTPWDGLDLASCERTGTYTGTMQKNLPNGKGKFETDNPTGEPWYYEGTFKDGKFNGYGERHWPGEDIKEVGNYIDGVFSPTKSQLFDTVSSDFVSKYELSDKSIAFIDKHEKLFPCSTEEEKASTVSLTDYDAQYKQLTKNISNYADKFVRVQNITAVQVLEENLVGHTLTYILANDSEYNFYTILIDGQVEIHDGDIFELYGLPVACSSFANISGGTTNVVVTLGSIINVDVTLGSTIIIGKDDLFVS